VFVASGRYQIYISTGLQADPEAVRGFNLSFKLTLGSMVGEAAAASFPMLFHSPHIFLLTYHLTLNHIFI
jgi:hypothetical protein